MRDSPFIMYSFSAEPGWFMAAIKLFKRSPTQPFISPCVMLKNKEHGS